MSDRRIFKSSRKDGRFLSTLAAAHAWYKHHTPKLAFDPKMSPADFPKWQRKVRARLRQVMNFPSLDGLPVPKRLWTADREGYRLEKWECYPLDHYAVRFLMMVPDEAGPKQRVPLVLCFPGTDHSKEMSAKEPEIAPLSRPNDHSRRPEHNCIGWWYVQRGMAAICFDNPGTSEQSDPIAPGRTELCLHLLPLGLHYVGLSSFIGELVYQWARRLSFVERRGIAVAGHSLGTGSGTMLTVLHPDIRALVYNGNLGSMRIGSVVLGMKASPVWHYTPGLLEWFDMPDLLAAIAPRPLLVSEGALPHAERTVRLAYRLVGASKAFKVHHFPAYRDPKKRKRASQRIPEGLTAAEFKTWRHLVSPEHYFKEDVAVPWLERALSRPQTAWRRRAT